MITAFYFRGYLNLIYVKLKKNKLNYNKGKIIEKTYLKYFLQKQYSPYKNISI